MHVAIDIDQTIYACGFAAEGEDISHALGNVKRKINETIKACQADTWSVHMAGEGNFRKDIAITQEYKGNRKAARPSNYDEIRSYLREVWSAEESTGMEADDSVSILLWEDYLKCEGNKELSTLILASPDKDLNNTPGWHYNPQKDSIRWVTLDQANRHFWYQMLTGDSTDNIKGLPFCAGETVFKYGLSKAALRGCGAASAKKVMEASSDAMDAKRDVIDAYLAWGTQEGMSESQIRDYMIEQGQLLWMIREYDEFGEPRMFTIEESDFVRRESGETGYEGDRPDEAGASGGSLEPDTGGTGIGWELHRGSGEGGRVTSIVEPCRPDGTDTTRDGETGGVE